MPSLVPSMATKRFFLLGEDTATAREIELPLDLELADLQEIVAAHFGIVEPKGTLAPSRDRRDLYSRFSRGFFLITK
jgi:hypothetical protein